VISVFRGGCAVVRCDELHSLRLVGKHAHREQSLAVGDEVTFDLERGIVLDLLPRRTQLARFRPRERREHVIAANVDRLAIVVAVSEPPFRSGAVDRLLLAAYAGGLDAILIANKIDQLGAGEELPDEIAAYREIVSIFPTCASSSEGVEPLLEHLAASRTVFAGHSGVGKTSLVNAMHPELRLETGELTRARRGRHTTTRATWIRLPGDAVVIDTPGVREIATGPADLALLDRVYPSIARVALECRFRDCRHDREPGCAVRAAVDAGEIPPSRLAGYLRLVREVEGASTTGLHG
jgi:ribosome biogenesis GTPase